MERDVFDREVHCFCCSCLGCVEAYIYVSRYAGHNNYIGFYRMVHDSKFPGDDVPPLPHSSTWFQHMEDTSARSGASTRTRHQGRRSSAADDDDDIAIERERISLKCPLTLLPFRDP